MSNVLQKECILKIKLRITKINNSIIDIRNITYESIDHISICHILARLECHGFCHMGNIGKKSISKTSQEFGQPQV